MTYHWMHIPTGKQGTTNWQGGNTADLKHMRELEFLRWLDKLNSQQPGVWQYWRA